MKPTDIYREKDGVIEKVEKSVRAMHEDDSLGNVNLLQDMESLLDVAKRLIDLNIAVDDFTTEEHADDISGKVELSYEPINEIYTNVGQAMRILIDVFEDTLDLE